MEVDGSFTPCKDADNDYHSKDGYCDKFALYFRVVKQAVDFFHNLKFSFSNKVYDQVFKGWTGVNTCEVLFKRSTEFKNRF